MQMVALTGMAMQGDAHLLLLIPATTYTLSWHSDHRCDFSAVFRRFNPTMHTYLKSNLHVLGLDRVLDEKRPSIQRMAWCLLLLVGFCFLCFHLYDRVSYFASGPILVDIQVSDIAGDPGTVVPVAHVVVLSRGACFHFLSVPLYAHRFKIFL